MNEKLTEIAVLVDRSGSMQGIWDDTLGGLRSFVADQKALPDEANLTLAVFDDQYDVPVTRRPVAQVNLDNPNFGPRSMTALYDALGRIIRSVHESIQRLPEAERPGKVIFAVFTDGAENASKEHSRESVFSMIKEREEKDSWNFLFLAAGKEALTEAGNLGFAAHKSVMYEATGENSRHAFKTVSTFTSDSRNQSLQEYQSNFMVFDLKVAFTKQGKEPDQKPDAPEGEESDKV